MGVRLIPEEHRLCCWSVFAMACSPRSPVRPTGQYYRAQVFFLPVFGLAEWLLSGGVVHLILRLAGVQSGFDWILNVIGWGLLTVMPAVWLLDWTSIAPNL